ncbi:MAG: RNA polymerase sigma factor [Lachnospiraceae bacterium]|mgnify:CR=1 FL=1|nr:RNA polymerase sigma factor [Lachnospiraceae bacterium]
MMLMYLTFLDDEGDRQKFERLYMAYRLKMQYVAYGIVKDEQEAENIVHDTFMALLDLLDRIHEEDCHKTWNYIVTIVKNKCFNYLKKQKKVQLSQEDIFCEDTRPDIAETVVHRDMAEVLVCAVQKLKYPYKEVIYLYYYNGLSAREIGSMLGLSDENVRQIASRARKKLKERLLEMGYSYGE